MPAQKEEEEGSYKGSHTSETLSQVRKKEEYKVHQQRFPGPFKYLWCRPPPAADKAPAQRKHYNYRCYLTTDLCKKQSYLKFAEAELRNMYME